ncbi:3'-5' exonuclease [Calycomorphotria hydatis]|uniref:Putative 3'-5' exonuclease related to the exonuclease domain of PolB n=1 Tax=Calycomorphotria hydatis TaxID=2528027 RepID=A0A517TB39_9PLAN|nr:3'-5' exonuclease [Calycomorphotria hydatis]QDT65591.1 putative 3'-5' exonuclease related to the exonuclease domain of PolB [Calycomorphotria hydatis]
MTAAASYFIFDVEAVGDGDLISKVRYPQEDLSAAEALAKYREELLELTGKDVLPPTFVLPISVVVGKVSAAFELLDVVALDEPNYRPHAIVSDFWKGWEGYRKPTLVTFNGRGYDMPVIELATYRYGLTVPEWFNQNARSFEQRRNRYNTASHIDLMDFMSNFGASRMTGGLNLLANLIGKPGKTGIDGSKVQEMYDAGEADAINDYCRCDVLDTYFVFLRSRVLTGELTLDREKELVDNVHQWLSEQSADHPAYAHYLQHWGDWKKPI